MGRPGKPRDSHAVYRPTFPAPTARKSTCPHVALKVPSSGPILENSVNVVNACLFCFRDFTGILTVGNRDQA